jgi:cob(I)alamin adenosyltransferase
VTDEPGGTGRRERIRDSLVATGRGDDGTTGLLFGGRVSKDDPRTEAYGTVDEAVAAMGVARARLDALYARDQLPEQLAGLAEAILRMQRELFVVAAELATRADARDRLRDGVTRVDESMVIRLEEDLQAAETGLTLGNEFVVPGASELSAQIEVARTIVRRAERRAIGLSEAGHAPGPWLIPYLNRLADLLWVLARRIEAAERAEPAHLIARLRATES